MVDEQVHDCFGHLVGNRFAHDVEVRCDQPPNQICLEGFAFGEGRGCAVVVGVGGVVWVGLC